MTESDKNEFHMRLTQVEMEMKANTLATSALQDDVSEVLDILGTARSGFKVLGVLGNVIKWSASIIAAVGAVWAAFHNGGPK